MEIASILWRRLDVPGHDACRLARTRDGWRLDGGAVFRHEDSQACLVYQVSCDRAWHTREGKVGGWIGARRVHLMILHTATGTWTVNGEVVPDVHDCVDLDLDFTPATNLCQVRRIALSDGQAADVPVAWLDVAAGSLSLLHQRYERQNPETYLYEAPRFGYAARLEVGSAGFVRRYPGLWEEEP